MEFPLRNIAGETAGTLTLNPALFDVPMNQALVHQVAVAHMANARQGTSSTKPEAWCQVVEPSLGDRNTLAERVKVVPDHLNGVEEG